MSYKTLSSRVVYQNRWLTVREDAIERSNGHQGIYSVVGKSDFALVIPMQDEHLYLVEQFRYAVQQRCREFPQGGSDDRSLSPLQLAQLELREETGFTAGRWQHLGRLFAVYGYSSQAFDVFLATDLKAGEADLEPEEHDLVVHRIAVSEFEAGLKSGTYNDGPSVAAWGLYMLHQGR